MNELTDDRPGFKVDRPLPAPTATCPCTVATESPREHYTVTGTRAMTAYAMAGGKWPEQVTLYSRREEESDEDDDDDKPHVEYDVLGSLRGLHRECDALIGTAHFSTGRAGTALRADVEGKHAVGILLRVSIHDHRWVQPGQSLEFDGRVYRAEGDVPLRLVTRWQAFDALAVPDGMGDVGKFGDCVRGYFDTWLPATATGRPLMADTRALLIERGMPDSFDDVAAVRWARRNLAVRDAATGELLPLGDY